MHALFEMFGMFELFAGVYCFRFVIVCLFNALFGECMALSGYYFLLIHIFFLTMGFSVINRID